MNEQDAGVKSKRYVDFLDILLTATDDTGIGLTREEIRQEVDTFLFEGDKKFIILHPLCRLILRSIYSLWSLVIYCILYCYVCVLIIRFQTLTIC